MSELGCPDMVNMCILFGICEYDTTYQCSHLIIVLYFTTYG